MDHRLVTAYLEMARRHIAEGKEHVGRQREIVAKIKKRGRDPSYAKMLLHRFERLPPMAQH
ncbi:hypothetical protein AC629_37060 [Bradyrhizobium sp. NAS80.1]|uniref:hypothetical protein n=1 Tax=Bradyrhizobium sp. NAS80.1 TaxID=1680159 RepID=UPI0009591583|nr:hypothetical protein [Bradyrhizobium sp. NAS80.1]OKO72993.1 hypothetical protein AC629_37060 [Bradyrhizobium sp. NAS80.1]